MLQMSTINKCKIKTLFETCLKFSIHSYFCFLGKKVLPNKVFASNFKPCISLGKQIVSITSLEAVQYYFQILFLPVRCARCLHPGFSLHNATFCIKLKSKDQVVKVVILKVFTLVFCCITEICWTWKVLSSQVEEKVLVYLKKEKKNLKG